MCGKKSLTTSLAKRKHAELMIGITQKMYELIFTGLIGIPVLHWLREEVPQNVFVAYLFVLVAGFLAALWLQRVALAKFDELGDNKRSDN